MLSVIVELLSLIFFNNAVYQVHGCSCLSFIWQVYADVLFVPKCSGLSLSLCHSSDELTTVWVIMRVKPLCFWLLLHLPSGLPFHTLLSFVPVSCVALLSPAQLLCCCGIFLFLLDILAFLFCVHTVWTYFSLHHSTTLLLITSIFPAVPELVYCSSFPTLASVVFPDSSWVSYFIEGRFNLYIIVGSILLLYYTGCSRDSVNIKTGLPPLKYQNSLTVFCPLVLFIFTGAYALTDTFVWSPAMLLVQCFLDSDYSFVHSAVLMIIQSSPAPLPF